MNFFVYDGPEVSKFLFQFFWFPPKISVVFIPNFWFHSKILKVTISAGAIMSYRVITGFSLENSLPIRNVIAKLRWP